jgi:uncharacterized coiled-coil DUF342 family protein
MGKNTVRQAHHGSKPAADSTSSPQASQRERIEKACARAGTLKDKIETARRSANEVRTLARGLKAELKETINLMNAIHRQMKELYDNRPIEQKTN